MIRPFRPALLQDRDRGFRMPEEHPGRPGFHRGVSRRAIRRPVLFILIFTSDGFGNRFISVPGRSDDLTQNRIRIGSLPQDDSPEPWSQ